MHKYFTDKAVSKKIRNLKVNKRLLEKQLEDYHYILKSHVDCARSELQHAIMLAMQLIDVNTQENDDVEKMVEILIQRPDKTANEIFTFTRDLLSKIEKMNLMKKEETYQVTYQLLTEHPHWVVNYSIRTYSLIG